jgi:OFA family oxalate/formate antiporter-like MFS transporter
VTARWFVKKRGLALGIVSSGIGIGTLIMPPVAERLIAIFSWSAAYQIIGITVGVVTIGCALFLRRDPQVMGYQPYGVETPLPEAAANPDVIQSRHGAEAGINFSRAIHTSPLWILSILFFFINISVQVVLVHIVNFATDIGISALAAATLISVIGIGGILGRLIMGTVSDRIGGNNALIITCFLLTASLLWLIFSRQLWMLYIFAVVFGFAYSGGVPQIPLLIGQFFGLRAVMALTGATSASTRVGGALGSWLGGKIFDVSHSYLMAFVVTAIASFLALVAAFMLKKSKTNITQI